MFDFYRIMYGMGYLSKQDVGEAAHWGVISLEEYERIVGEPYDA